MVTLELFVLEYVHSVRAVHPGIGGEKLWHMYKGYFGDKYSLGRDAFMDILRSRKLLLRNKGKGVRTTDSRHNFPTYPNLVNNLFINKLSQVWVSDITYIAMQPSAGSAKKNDFCFLSLITDAYSRQIVGWFVGPTLATVYSLNALENAMRKFPPESLNGLIHHSDRGCQYASYAYTDVLKEKGILISMTQGGNPKENAIAERVNGILKTEFLCAYEFKNITEVRQAVHAAVEQYNTQRPHRSLNMLTPDQAAKSSGEIPKCWNSYKDKYRKICL